MARRQAASSTALARRGCARGPSSTANGEVTVKWLQHQYAVQIIGGVAAAAIFAIGVAIWHAATTDSPSDTSANPAHGPSPFLSSPTVEPSRSNPSTSSSTAATTSTSPTNVPSAVYYLADLTTANPSDGPPNTGLAHIGGA